MPATVVGGSDPQPPHQRIRLGEVGDTHREGVGRVDAVLDGEVVEQVEEGAALRLEGRGQLGQQERGADAVLVADELRRDAVAEGLLVAEAQPVARGRST